jgi:hypothetical protein
MPDYKPAHEHAHTPLKVPRTNVGSLTGAGVIAGLVAVCTLFLKAFDTGHAGWVPGEVQPYLPWVVFAATIILAFLGGVGVPSLHPGLPLTQKHYGRIEMHDPGKEDEQVL